MVSWNDLNCMSTDAEYVFYFTSEFRISGVQCEQMNNCELSRNNTLYGFIWFE